MHTIPGCIQTLWIPIRNNLHLLNEVKIARHALSVNAIDIQLHGQVDKSQITYVDCVYLRCEDSFGHTSTKLLCSKSKVAALKVLTIPRLKLCVAPILAKLMHKILNSLIIKFSHVYLWSDSQVVLAWLKTTTASLKIFVANQVIQIHELTNSIPWKYVPSLSNPTDLVSRGMKPEEIIQSELWWVGPKWLSEDRTMWPQETNSNVNDIPELRPQSANAHGDKQTRYHQH